MKKTIEIKAIDKEKALERAFKILNINLEDNKLDVKVVEKIKPKKKFFGLFGIENGVYEVSVQEKVIKEKSEEKNIKSKNKKNNEKEKLEVVEKKIQKNLKNEEKKETKKVIEQNPEEEKEILTVVKELLTKMELDLKVEIKKVKDKHFLVNLYGKDNAIIIGQKGKTLNNFEHILNSLLKKYRVEVDVEKFKEKRYETLKFLGKKMAEKVLKTNKTVRLNSMPPRERKIIHEIVNKYQGLDTFSEGREPKRYIVIKKKK